MVETSRILHHATERSLVLLDEVGRGTSTYDGLSIAWAVAERLSLAGTARPRTIFATHFHELTRLAEEAPGVLNLHVQVKEWGDRIVFVRKVREGGADRSYGIQVARLAGVPDSVIARAQEVLGLLEAEGRRTRTRLPGRAVPQPQLSLFESGPTPEEREILEALRQLEIDRISPVEALTLLDRWQSRLRE
jgi:DNA mismatch repair protein MutS